MKLCLLLLPAVLFAGSADPFVGAWHLNPSKSRYAPGQCPKSMTIEMASAGNGISYRSETEFADGRRSKTSYTAAYDGPEALVMGSAGMQTPVVLKRLGYRMVEADYVRNMHVVASSRRVLSANDRVMTITTTSKDKNGKEITSFGVYEKDVATAAAQR